MTSKSTAYSQCPFSPQFVSAVILSLWSLRYSVIHISLQCYMIKSLHCEFIPVKELLTWPCLMSSILTAVMVAASRAKFQYRAAIDPDIAPIVLRPFDHLVRMLANRLLNPSIRLMWKWGLDRLVALQCTFNITWRWESDPGASGTITNNRFLRSVNTWVCFTPRNK